MSRGMITREELLCMQKRRRVKRGIVISIIGFIVSACVCVYGWACLTINRHNRRGAAVSYKVESSIGNSRVQMYSYDYATQMPNEPEPTEEELFIEPEINGANWADLTRYYPNFEIVDDSYFDNAVFIGDSRTEGLMLYSGLPNFNGICYKGLSVDKLTTKEWVTLPDQTEKMTCYEAVSRSQYDAYYVMFGVNELGWSNLELFVQEFSDLIDHIYSVNPDAMVYVESILPVTRKKSDSSTVYTLENVNIFNDALLKMCKNRNDVIYLDIASAIADEDGYLPDDSSTDGVHCNADTCKILMNYIRENTYRKQ